MAGDENIQTLVQLTEVITNGNDLSFDQATQAARHLARNTFSLESRREFLVALAEKGETAIEVAAFASTFRELAVDPGVGKWAANAIDVCGTGGDGSGTFNISTAVSFLVASLGVPVFKHGNRSITSKCGSADLMEAIGIRLDASQEMIHASLTELNFCFFFAPAFHPVFKEIMPVRKMLAAEGQRTIFNLLGPLINPGRPAYQLLGVFSPDWVAPISQALHCMSLKSGLVVHGTPADNVALDELSCAGINLVAGFGDLKSEQGTVLATDANLASCDLSELAGGNVEENLVTMNALLSGSSNSVAPGLRNSVLLNAGAALWIAKKAANLSAGVAMAADALAAGQVARWLEKVRNFYNQA